VYPNKLEETGRRINPEHDRHSMMLINQIKADEVRRDVIREANIFKKINLVSPIET